MPYQSFCIEGSLKSFGGGVVAKGFAEVGKAIDIARGEDEGPAQLEGIRAEFVLVVAGGAGALAAMEIVAAQNVKEVGGGEACDFVGLALLVD